jgi:hypothetical protein
MDCKSSFTGVVAFTGSFDEQELIPAISPVAAVIAERLIKQVGI